MVNPHSALSLQLHCYHSKYWIVISGKAQVMRGKESFYLYPNQSAYIENGTKLRLSNPNDQLL